MTTTTHTVLRVIQSSKKPFFMIGVTFNSIYSSQVSLRQKTKDNLQLSRWGHRSHRDFIQNSMIPQCIIDFQFSSLEFSFPPLASSFSESISESRKSMKKAMTLSMTNKTDFSLDNDIETLISHCVKIGLSRSKRWIFLKILWKTEFFSCFSYFLKKIWH